MQSLEGRNHEYGLRMNEECLINGLIQNSLKIMGRVSKWFDMRLVILNDCI